MAESGYCSECGRDVELTPEGECPSGHGAECITDPHDAPPAETPGQEPAAPEPEIESEPADAAPLDEEEPAAPAEAGLPEPSGTEFPPMAPTPMTPQRNRTGLVVVVIAILLILGACVATGLLLLPRLQKAGTTGTQAAVTVPHAKLQTAIGFMEALLNNDTMAIKPFLADSAQNAITLAQWKSIESATTTGSATFTAPVWTDDTKARVTFQNADTTGTLTFSLDSTKPNDVTMVGASADASETDSVSLVAAGSAWRVSAITSQGGGTTTFDATFVKSMVATGTAQ